VYRSDEQPVRHPPVSIALLAAVAVVTACGLYLRLLRVVPAEFPLNDGGLFCQMTAELMSNGYRLPLQTGYNRAGIPFAYPPAGFYLLGWLSAITGAGLVELLRVVPAVVSALAVPAFAMLALALTRSAVATVAATAAFTLLVRSWLWLVMGGGLTRALGFLFAILTLQQLTLLYADRRRRWLVGVVLCAGLTVLSHPGSAWFVAYSAAVLLALRGRSRAGLRDTAVVALGVVLVTAPWWTTVVLRHGWAPLLAAARAGGDEAGSADALRYFLFSDEPFLDVLGTLGLIGFLLLLLQRRPLLPGWLLLVALLNPRSTNQSASVPLALLIGVTIEAVLLPGLRLAFGGRRWGTWDPAGLVLGGLGVYAVMAARSSAGNSNHLDPLPAAERAAMHWAAEQTEPQSRFLVVTQRRSGTDPTSEWLPALTGRTSVATAQGYEWLPGAKFAERVARHDSLGECVTRDVACVEAWAQRAHAEYDYLFVPEPGSEGLRRSLRSSALFTPVYDSGGVAIFARRAARRAELGVTPAPGPPPPPPGTTCASPAPPAPRSP
jgi:hypothetical protein